jgi:hypothetical protein
MLYSSGAVRQIRLPHLRGWTDRRYSVLRIPIPASVGQIRWRKVLSAEEYQEALDRICVLAPGYEEKVRQLPPTSEIGHLLITRTGPACPDIERADGGYLARESLKAKLESVPAIEFYPAYLTKIVPLKWELGQPVPKEFEYYEPESYILDGKHSPEVAAQMASFYEVILPKQKWYEINKIPKGEEIVRVAFESMLPSKGMPNTREGLVEVALNSPVTPWFIAVPEDENVYGAYHFAREDVCEILREPGEWTLEFKQVKQF